MSVAEELQKLDDLRKSGVISEAEFEEQKKTLLNGKQPPEITKIAPPSPDEWSAIPLKNKLWFQLLLALLVIPIGIGFLLFCTAYQQKRDGIKRVAKWEKALFIVIFMLAWFFVLLHSASGPTSSSNQASATDNQTSDGGWTVSSEHDDLTGKDSPILVHTDSMADGTLQTKFVCSATMVDVMIEHDVGSQNDCDVAGFKYETGDSGQQANIVKYTIDGSDPKAEESSGKYCNQMDFGLIAEKSSSSLQQGIAAQFIAQGRILPISKAFRARDFRMQVETVNGATFVIKASPATDPAFQQFAQQCPTVRNDLAP